MNSSKIGDWIQILASLGVLIGLFAVAYELRQNSVFAQIEHSRENHRNWMQVSYLEIETDIFDSLVRSIEDPENLSAEDMFKLSAWMQMNMSILVYGDTANQAGVAASTSLMSEGAARYFFSSKFSRQWFAGNKAWLGKRQVDIISRVIESTPVAKSKEELFQYLLNSESGK